MHTLRSFLWVSALLAVTQLRGESLDQSPSSFVRAHAQSPVKWQIWDHDAQASAKKENKPIYVIIGQTTSELSQAMLRQSFSNPQVADQLNKNFICVVVDKEEFPALAALYQSYVVTKKQMSGWPLNVWLTPDLKPIEAATYLPPSEEWGKEGFLNVVNRVVTLWAEGGDVLTQRSEEAAAEVIAAEYMPDADLLDEKALEDRLTTAEKLWLERYNSTHACFGEPPLHPEPELLQFLLQRPGVARDAALQTLRSIATSPLRDPLDGGFFRYASDSAWRLPYLQKVASDQARLAFTFLKAAELTKDDVFLDAARGALSFALQHLRGENKGFLAALDASGEDSRIGYSWTLDELRQVLGEGEAATFAKAHGATETGNVDPNDDPSGKLKGRNFLRPAAIADSAAYRVSYDKLLKVRSGRAKARPDANSTAATNGFMLAALSTAAATLNDAGFRKAAVETAAYIESTYLDASSGKLTRLAGSQAPAVAVDYALVAHGLACLYQLTQDEKHKALAQRLLATASASFLDSKTGRFYAAPAEGLGLWHRPFTAIPAGGEIPSAESIGLLTSLQLGETAASKESLAGGLAAELDDTAGAPNGGSLVAGSSLLNAAK